MEHKPTGFKAWKEVVQINESTNMFGFSWRNSKNSLILEYLVEELILLKEKKAAEILKEIVLHIKIRDFKEE